MRSFISVTMRHNFFSVICAAEFGAMNIIIKES